MSVRIIEGDCRTVLATLVAASVQCVVTSPPYYGLRDYGVAGQLGLEATPDDYIATMVQVFRAVRRVLRPDGTCWVNLGDSYARTGGTDRTVSASARAGNTRNSMAAIPDRTSVAPAGLADKQLLLMPARLALALQADGWWLRSDIIWAKPNPMPESVTDRPTNAHEHLFLLTKAARYFYDADAVREDAQDWSNGGPGTGIKETYHYGAGNGGNAGLKGVAQRYKDGIAPSGRNLRNVWTIATAPFPEAHFATFPPELAERCIKAGTSERGCCAQCGKPWVRQTERQRTRDGEPLTGGWNTADGYKIGASGVGHWRDVTAISTTGWSAACRCNAPTQPCVVLDPFAGAGTTGLCADRLQRDAVLIELNPGYCAMLRNRILADAPLFAEVGG